jgi:hypothetical protein
LKLLRAGKGRLNRDQPDLQNLVDHQLSQLNQLLGQLKYRPADAILRGFLPRMTNNVGSESRAAAMWALGLIHEGNRNTEVKKLAIERLTDVNTTPPEDYRIRSMSAILLGRLGAKDSLDTLKRFASKFELTGDRVNDACNWSIARITGVAMPAPKTYEIKSLDWFLTPR